MASGPRVGCLGLLIAKIEPTLCVLLAGSPSLLFGRGPIAFALIRCIEPSLLHRQLVFLHLVDLLGVRPHHAFLRGHLAEPGVLLGGLRAGGFVLGRLGVVLLRLLGDVGGLLPRSVVP